jgi:hypothetical protein
MAATTATSFAQPVMTPSLMIVHGIEGSDLGAGYQPTLPVDLTIDGVCVSKQPLQFGTVSGPYPLNVGVHTVKVNLANTLSPCSNPIVLIDKTFSLAPSQQFALVLAESTAGKPVGEFLGLTETVPVPVGAARVVIYHSANAPAIDVTVTQNSTGAVSTLTDLLPGSVHDGDFAPFTPYSLRVLATGTTNVVAGPVGFSGSNRAIEAFFVVGNAADGSVAVISKELYGVY